MYVLLKPNLALPPLSHLILTATAWLAPLVLVPSSSRQGALEGEP